MKKIILTNLFITCAVLYSLAQETGPIYPSWVTLNNISTSDAIAPIQGLDNFTNSTIRDVKVTTQYYDALGRPLQTVNKQASPLGYDLVKATLYDDLGREQLNFLPYVAPSQTGSFEKSAYTQQVSFYNSFLSGQGETYYYGKNDFEISPLNRPFLSMPPGNSWVGNSKGIQTHYFNNTSTDDVAIWEVIDQTIGTFGLYKYMGAYTEGTLFKTITEDEHGNQVIEFKDKSGNIILKKVQLTDQYSDDGTGSGNEGWLCTYYVYDDVGNLSAVFPPKAVDYIRQGMHPPPPPGEPEILVVPWDIDEKVLTELCFQYAYDANNRLICKQVPGAKPVYMVYNAKDQLVLTQDYNLSNKNKWLYTLYDELGRPLQTGLWHNVDDWNAHYTAAFEATIYPNLESEEYNVLTNTYYDNYNWISTLPSTSASISNTMNGDDLTSFSTDYAQWPYPCALSQSTALKGMVTGTMVSKLDNYKPLYSINYYDDRGRVIQAQSENINGGRNINTTQYSFSGQPLTSVMRHLKMSTSTPFIVSTNMIYDEGGRLIRIQKKLDDGTHTMTNWKTISRMSYDELGQLKMKEIGNAVPGFNGTTTTSGFDDPLTDLSYEYNIRGWLLGINRGFVSAANGTNGYFGFELAYDKKTAASNTANYLPLYNGNIAGVTWKLKGDEVKRRYDFTYDKVNRLLSATFTQVESLGWGNNVMDFSVRMGNHGNDPLAAYDANGNIIKMIQHGFKLGGAAHNAIDQLTYDYSYSGFSNKLENVTDEISDATKLGDFKDGNNPQGVNDYSYDDNGNLIQDNNKQISSITYNHLNLPTRIDIPSKGYIEYLYDATGNKLRKTVHEDAVSTDKITDYIAGFVYENDDLKFVNDEEGRIRYVAGAAVKEDAFLFDYFLKDHLGNVRSVITEEQQKDIYPAVTLETGATTVEDTYYTITGAGGSIEDTPAQLLDNNPSENYDNNNVIPNPNPTCSTTVASQKMYKLNGTGGGKTALGITLKVMAGDKLDIHCMSYYYYNGGNLSNNSIPILNILSGLLGTPGSAASSGVHGIVSSSTINTSANTSGITSMFNTQTSQSNNTLTVPKAYINYLFFDEQFKCVGSGFSKVGSSDHVKPHFSELQNLTVPKNGFVYIYCSNESPVDVFFDNLQVVHTRSPLLEETSYYPFGLTMAAISSKAAGKMDNKEKTFQGQRFDDDLGLNWVEFKYRNHDPQIGRFIEIDPLANKYVYNSPYDFSENHVTTHVELEGLEKFDIKTQNEYEENKYRGKGLRTTQEDNVSSRSSGMSLKGPEPGFEPTIGATATSSVVTSRTPASRFNSPFVGSATVTNMSGVVTGKEGTFNVNATTVGKEIEGGDISVKGFSFGGSLSTLNPTVGIPTGGGNSVSLTMPINPIGVALTGITIGASHTEDSQLPIASKTINTSELNIRPGEAPVFGSAVGGLLAVPGIGSAIILAASKIITEPQKIQPQHAY